MQIGLRRFFAAIITASIGFVWMDPAQNFALALILSLSIAGIVLLTSGRVWVNVICALIGAVAGAFVLGDVFADKFFAVRDGNYALDTLLPGRIAGAVCGWTLAIVVLRYIRSAAFSRTKTPLIGDKVASNA